MLQRALTEARAGRHAVDARFELNGPEMEALYREGCSRNSGARISRISRPGRSRSTSCRRPFQFFTIAYNTKLVKPEEVPNSYEDLLHRRWVGKIGIEASDDDWFASIVKHMGEQLAFPQGWPR